MKKIMLVSAMIFAMCVNAEKSASVQSHMMYVWENGFVCHKSADCAMKHPENGKKLFITSENNCTHMIKCSFCNQ